MLLSKGTIGCKIAQYLKNIVSGYNTNLIQ